MDKSGIKIMERAWFPEITTSSIQRIADPKYTSGCNDYHEFKEIKDIRTVFWVMSKDSGNSGSPLCHQSTHHFYSNGNQFWHPKHTHVNIRNGSLRINGLPGSSSSKYPNSLAVVSLRTTGNVTASRLGKDRNHGGNYNWSGKFGEVLIFSEALSDKTIERVENYLLTRWKIERKSKITLGSLAYLSFEDRNGNRFQTQLILPNRQTPMTIIKKSWVNSGKEYSLVGTTP